MNACVVDGATVPLNEANQVHISCLGGSLGIQIIDKSTNILVTSIGKSSGMLVVIWMSLMCVAAQMRMGWSLWRLGQHTGRKNRVLVCTCG